MEGLTRNIVRAASILTAKHDQNNRRIFRIQSNSLRFAKYMMKTKNQNTHTNAKLAVDLRLAEQLEQIGIISGPAELSRACGKNPTYFACMRKRGYSLHVGSLAFLQARFSRDMNETTDIRKRALLRSAVSLINEAIQEKCKLRELELLQ